jgi:hypothetical protein
VTVVRETMIVTEIMIGEVTDLEIEISAMTIDLLEETILIIAGVLTMAEAIEAIIDVRTARDDFIRGEQIFK